MVESWAGRHLPPGKKEQYGNTPNAPVRESQALSLQRDKLRGIQGKASLVLPTDSTGSGKETWNLKADSLLRGTEDRRAP